MKRALLVISTLLLLLLTGSAPDQHLLAQEPARDPSPPAPGAPPAPDPLEEFVPHEKVEADSIVSFPVDI